MNDVEFIDVGPEESLQLMESFMIALQLLHDLQLELSAGADMSGESAAAIFDALAACAAPGSGMRSTIGVPGDSRKIRVEFAIRQIGEGDEN